MNTFDNTHHAQLEPRRVRVPIEKPDSQKAECECPDICQIDHDN